MEDKAFWYLINIPLDNSLSYQNIVNIDGVDCIFDYGYNSFLKKRWISISTRNGEVLLERTLLTLGCENHLNVNADILDLTRVKIFLRKKEDLKEFDPENWGDNAELLIVGLYRQYREEVDKASVDIFCRL